MRRLTLALAIGCSEPTPGGPSPADGTDPTPGRPLDVDPGADDAARAPSGGPPHTDMPDLVFLEGEAGDQTGLAAAGGDLDADGLPDLAFGAPCSGTACAGAVRVAWGSIGGVPQDPVLGWAGESHHEGAGRAVAVGDLDGDGTDDLVVGADGRGAARVYLGPLDSTSSPADHRIEGDIGDRLGHGLRLASVRDGTDEAALLVTAPLAGDAAGALYIIPGADIGSGAGLESGTRILGQHPRDGLVETASALGTGDWDGDGIVDLALGAPGFDGSARGSGRAYVFLGGMDGDGAAWGAADADIWIDRDTAERNAHLGSAVAGAGDWDGDGTEDLLLAARWASEGPTDGGVVWLMAGGPDGPELESPLLTVHGESAAAGLGAAMTAVPDLDGDGSAELVLTAPTQDTALERAGRAYAFLSASGHAGVVSAAQADTVLDGEWAQGGLGGTAVVVDPGGGRTALLVLGVPGMEAAHVLSLDVLRP